VQFVLLGKESGDQVQPYKNRSDREQHVHDGHAFGLEHSQFNAQAYYREASSFSDTLPGMDLYQGGVGMSGLK